MFSAVVILHYLSRAVVYTDISGEGLFIELMSSCRCYGLAWNIVLAASYDSCL